MASMAAWNSESAAEFLIHDDPSKGIFMLVSRYFGARTRKPEWHTFDSLALEYHRLDTPGANNPMMTFDVFTLPGMDGLV